MPRSSGGMKDVKGTEDPCATIELGDEGAFQASQNNGN